jgi:hypothetical protein
LALFRNSYFWAIVFHLAIFAGLGVYTSGQTTAKTTKTPQSNAVSATTPSSEPVGFSADKPPFSLTQVDSRIAASLDSASRMTSNERLGAAGDYATQLESISSVSSMREMGVYLRSTVSWRPPQSRAEPGQEKIFDHATSTPAGARQLSDGRYVFVFKDANNNICETPVAAGDENAAIAMNLLDRSDVLREFKNNILLPMLNQRLDAR